MATPATNRLQLSCHDYNRRGYLLRSANGDRADAEPGSRTFAELVAFRSMARVPGLLDGGGHRGDGRGHTVLAGRRRESGGVSRWQVAGRLPRPRADLPRPLVGGGWPVA